MRGRLRSGYILITIIVLLVLSAIHFHRGGFANDLSIHHDQAKNRQLMGLIDDQTCGQEIKDKYECDDDDCEDYSGLINYIYFYKCTISSRLKPLGFALFVIWAIFLVIIIGDTADDYFSPILEAMVIQLKVPSNIAGVTFLSFGNGAPDVFTMLASALRGSFEFGISSICGAGLFVTTVVVGCVILIGKKIVLTRNLFLRDILFYIVAVVILFIIFIDGKVMWYEALIFLLIYISFVVFAIWRGMCKDKDKPRSAAPSNNLNTSLLDPLGVLEPDTSLQQKVTLIEDTLRSNADQNNNTNQNETADIDMQDLLTVNVKPAIPLLQNKGQYQLNEGDLLTTKLQTERAIRHSIQLDDVLEYDTAMRKNSLTFPKRLASRSHTEIRGMTLIDPTQPPRGIWTVIKDASHEIFETSYMIPVKIIEFPLTLARIFTIPTATPDVYSYEANLLCYFLIPFFCAFAFGLPWGYYTFIYLSISILVTALFGYISPRDRSPTSKIFVFSVLMISFGMSVLWIYLIANEIVALFQTFGLILNIPLPILAVTIMAWGNSLGDLVADISITKTGFPSMAIAGTFAGPLFNMLFGMGLGLLITCIRDKTALDLVGGLDNQTFTLIYLSFFFLFVGLMTTMILVSAHKFTVPRYYSFFLLSFYMIFLVLSILIATNVFKFVIKF